MQFQLHPKIIIRVAIALLPVNVCHKGKKGAGIISILLTDTTLHKFIRVMNWFSEYF